jgi:SAM-dependent methyltransferase
MKRIIGRKMVDDQTKVYGSFKVQTLNLELVDDAASAFRFRWASDIIDTLRASGLITTRALDIGTHNAFMAAIIAKKSLNPDDPDSPTTIVDAIESHNESYIAAANLAQQARNKGLKLDVHNVTFDDFNTESTYDVITAFEILEHTKDPMFFIEKVYDLLEIGGHLLLTVPEEHGRFGLGDKNCWHYWTATVQSVISTMFYDDRKWRIKQCFDHDTLLHLMVQKTTYQA